ncbi:MAG: MBL fold metallo-hydrolase [Clostridiales bacterium]|nr:MBL fold metallo-hydrolase [Clostridiales bacterium]
MDFRYLGTAAAEGWPAVFCRCEHCNRARAAGGRNIRTRSQAIINDDLLIDFPPDANMHMLQNGLDYSGVKYLIVTHSHLDHFAPVDLFFRDDVCYAHNLKVPQMLLYGPPKVIDTFRRYLEFYPDERIGKYIVTQTAEFYKPVTMGRYTVTPLRANHMTGNDAAFYLITDGEKTVLYMHDTGMLYDDALDYLKSHSVHADFVSFDCTYVLLPSGGGHLGLDTCCTVRDILTEAGVIGEHTVKCVNHFSHNGKAIYDELVPVAAKEGFLVSYDGMPVKF